MSRPLLFQHFESNSAKTVHMAIYHKEDHHYLKDRMKTFQGEQHLVVAKGEENKIYANPAEGIKAKAGKPLILMV